MSETAIIIPARWGSTRLPGKALADLEGCPMVVRVAARAARAQLGPVWVATDSAKIADVVEAAGFRTVRTGVHVSGSDRVAAAARSLGLSAETQILNVQGDEPLIDPRDLRALANAHGAAGTPMGTLARPERWTQRTPEDPAQVWVARAEDGRALDFWRGAEARFPVVHAHVGVYAYTAEALAAFTALSPSPRERVARLEQLRALDAQIDIHVAFCVSSEASLGVDTPADLERARAQLRGAPTSVSKTRLGFREGCANRRTRASE